MELQLQMLIISKPHSCVHIRTELGRYFDSGMERVPKMGRWMGGGFQQL